MTKADLIAKVAAQADMSKKDAEKAVNTTLEVITAALADGEKIDLAGFGTFETRERAARTGRDPRTKLPAATVPAFKANKALKDAVNK